MGAGRHIQGTLTVIPPPPRLLTARLPPVPWRRAAIARNVPVFAKRFSYGGNARCPAIARDGGRRHRYAPGTG